MLRMSEGTGTQRRRPSVALVITWTLVGASVLALLASRGEPVVLAFGLALLAMAGVMGALLARNSRS